MANKNRQTGHLWERDCIRYLTETFPFLTSYNPRLKNFANANIGSSRLFSTITDFRKIDIWKDSTVNPKLLRFKEQCKKSLIRTKKDIKIDVSHLYDVVIRDNQIPVLMTKVTRPAGSREKVYGEFVTMRYEDMDKHFKSTFIIAGRSVTSKNFKHTVMLFDDVFNFIICNHNQNGSYFGSTVTMKMKTYLLLLKQYVNE